MSQNILIFCFASTERCEAKSMPNKTKKRVGNGSHANKLIMFFSNNNQNRVKRFVSGIFRLI